MGLTEIGSLASMRSQLPDRGLVADMTNCTRYFGRNESQGWVGKNGRAGLASVLLDELDGALLSKSESVTSDDRPGLRLTVILLLNWVANQERNFTDNVIRKEDREAISSVFQNLGKVSPESFRINWLPLLNLPGDMWGVIRREQIE
ncbi:hypothetical protein NG791_23220 [Laspinema sp. D1]|uniref:hypothetical protein n=1 Tax=Laspinema palackyanum TaxID=3231601 RepID=UPI003494FCD5|nr:hypothetical protein [Laspinema sp. D2b]